MKKSMNQFMVTGLLTLVSASANAAFYNCMFTEPFMNVIYATNAKNVIVQNADESTATVIQSVSASFSNTVVKLKDGNSLTINYDFAGNDGMSDFNYPYSATYAHPSGLALVGGCFAEFTHKDTRSFIKRRSSLNSSHGLSIVNYWPGEWGALSGYEATQKVKFAANQTLEDLDSNIPSDKSCTIAKGKKIAPYLQKKREEFISISNSLQFEALQDVELSTNDKSVLVKKGQQVTELSGLAENQCLVEVGSVVYDSDCISSSRVGESFKEVSHSVEASDNGEVALGRWTKFQCQNDKSYRWIHESELEKQVAAGKMKHILQNPDGNNVNE